MFRRMTSIATLTVAGLLCVSAWAQVAPPGSGGDIGGPNAAAPSGAATTHTPGTPGASDTPGALQSNHVEGSAPSAADIRKLKKQASKAARSSAPAAAP